MSWVHHMIAILTIFYQCAGNHSDCHTLLDAEFELEEHEVSQDAHHVYLTEHGWLLVGELAYCPECRYELHDHEGLTLFVPIKKRACGGLNPLR